MDHTVFISYSSSDKAVAEQICSSLEGAGIGCWIAPRDIPPGADYPAAILAGIQGSSALVVVVSASAVTSPHILTEVGHAFSAKRRIIPFRLSAADLPADLDYFLSMSQWLDASGGVTPENLARLKDVLSRPPQRTPAADPVRGSSPGSTNTGTSIGIDIRVVGPAAGDYCRHRFLRTAIARWQERHRIRGKINPARGHQGRQRRR